MVTCRVKVLGQTNKKDGKFSVRTGQVGGAGLPLKHISTRGIVAPLSVHGRYFDDDDKHIKQMFKTKMPASEVEAVEMEQDELQSYELAFHILPTVAEEEVGPVVEAIKSAIVNHGGEIIGEEAAERFELAYEITKHIEGKNLRFRSAYFGWVRFKASPEAAVAIDAEIKANLSVLRHLLTKLTRVEEENPFNFHEAIRAEKQVTDIDEQEVVPEVEETEKEEITDDSVEETTSEEEKEEKTAE